MKRDIKIDFIRCIMNYMIVCLHAWAAFQYVDRTTIEFKSWTFVLSHLCGLAMPAFFLISGYLFFAGFEMKKWPSKIGKRFRRLFIPYIVWNTTFVVFYLSVSHFVPRIGERVASFGLTTVSGSISKIISLTVPPIDGPLWFLRALMVISVLTPVIWLAMRYLKKWVFVGLLVSWCLLEGHFGLKETMSMIMPAYALLCFSVGGIIADASGDLVTVFRSRIWLVVGFVSCVIRGCVVIPVPWQIPDSIDNLLVMLQGPALLSLVAHCNVQGVVKNKVYLFFNNMSFFAYAGHFLFCSMFLHAIAPKLGFMTTGKMTVLVLAFVGLGMPTMAGVYCAMKKTCPRLLKLYNGTL